MHSRFSLLVFFTSVVVPALSFAQAEKSATWPLEIFEVMDNSKLVIFIKDKDIEKSPSWSPAQGKPPLSIEKVLDSVKKWIAHNPDLNGLAVRGIKLKPINHHKNHWYYIVQLKSISEINKKPGYIAVLLSGQVVPAMVEPASIK